MMAGCRETQDVVSNTARQHKITADVRSSDPEDQRGLRCGMLKQDVKYRFVIDMSSR